MKTSANGMFCAMAAISLYPASLTLAADGMNTTVVNDEMFATAESVATRPWKACESRTATVYATERTTTPNGGSSTVERIVSVGYTVVDTCRGRTLLSLSGSRSLSSREYHWGPSTLLETAVKLADSDGRVVANARLNLELVGNDPDPELVAKSTGTEERGGIVTKSWSYKGETWGADASGSVTVAGHRMSIRSAHLQKTEWDETLPSGG